MARRAAKIDANQNEIVDALRALGCTVQSLAEVGDGCPDLLVGVEHVDFILEVKIPGEELNARQTKWHREWNGRAHVVWTVDQALDVAKKYIAWGIAFPW